MRPTRTLPRILSTTALATAGVFAAPAIFAGSDQAIDVPAQDLFTAIEELSTETGVPIAVNARFVENRRSNAVVGPMSARQALEKMLDDPDLAISELQDGGLAIVPTNRLNLVSQNATDETLDLGTLVLTSDEARAGVFGDRPIQDVPFSVTSFTSELIENQQAGKISDVLENDPSVRSNVPRGGSTDQFIVRGFPIFNSEVALEGLFGLTPGRSTSLQPYEKVEVFRGPNAILNGVPPFGNIGGVINLVPKRAEDTPITDLSFSYESEGHIGTHLDFGRRYGENGEFGLRFNGAFSSGDLTGDNNALEDSVAGLALDYRGDRLRVTADFLYQDLFYDAPQNLFLPGSGDFAIPDAPNGATNNNAPFAFSENITRRGVVGFEYDILDNWTLSARYGTRQGDERGLDALARTIVDGAGTLSGSTVILGESEIKVDSYDVGLSGEFATGSVNHEVALQYSGYKEDAYRAVTGALVPTFGGTLDAPEPLLTRPELPPLGPLQRNRSRDFKSFAAVWTSKFLEDRLQFTGGLRWQDLSIDNFSEGTLTTSYDDSEVSPVLGIVYKPREELSLYASYSEGLTPGPFAPGLADNAGEAFAPFVSEQYEMGAKWDTNGFGASISIFQISQPQSFIEPATNLFRVDGEIENRGIETLVYGNLTENLRLLGGVTFMDGKQAATAGGATDGNDAIGIPNVQLNLYAEYQVPRVPGLTLSGRYIYTSSQELNAENTQSIPSWDRIDVGASYDFDVNGTPATVNLDITNVTDSAYWQSTGRSFLSLGAPRTVRLTTAFKF
ncbi:TonB-dependent siderophore receptor [Thalassococcus sp. S3]|nr:TonB-dependent siderophore receptor [Thalassococcus sp. S3]